MTAEQIIQQILFFISAALTLGSAVMVVATRKLIQAALWLIVSLFGVAVLYALLDASFLVVVQVVVYIGAIAILFIFAVMLTQRDQRDKGPQLNKSWVLAALVGLATFGGLTFLVSSWTGFGAAAAPIPAGTVDMVADLGTALVSVDQYVLPFEVASVLLLAALIGAIYVAYNRK
ncbi:MAG: NADH-quinone oxidoreductase subunit J [Anaerolineales bacterium]|nr:NADH-quinone oxidoreductase subunit J [Anaerolineales bacterium]